MQCVIYSSNQWWAEYSTISLTGSLNIIKTTNISNGDCDAILENRQLAVLINFNYFLKEQCSLVLVKRFFFGCFMHSIKWADEKIISMFVKLQCYLSWAEKVWSLFCFFATISHSKSFIRPSKMVFLLSAIWKFWEFRKSQCFPFTAVEVKQWRVWCTLMECPYVVNWSIYIVSERLSNIPVSHSHHSSTLQHYSYKYTV